MRNAIATTILVGTMLTFSFAAQAWMCENEIRAAEDAMKREGAILVVADEGAAAPVADEGAAAPAESDEMLKMKLTEERAAMMAEAERMIERARAHHNKPNASAFDHAHAIGAARAAREFAHMARIGREKAMRK